MNEKTRDQKSDRMTVRSYPKALQQFLSRRIDALERELRVHSINASWDEVLNEFRSNTHIGITNPVFVMKYRETAVVECARLLDETWALLHASRSHPENYLTKGVLSAAARLHRRGQSDPDTQRAEKQLKDMGIADAPRGGISERGSQGWIREEVRKKNTLSKRTIDGLAAKVRKEAKLQKGIASI